MYLLAKFDGHGPYGNRDINSYINSYMNTSKKAELTASIYHIERFSKSGILIHNSKVPDMTGRETRKRRTQRIKKCYAFQKSSFWKRSYVISYVEFLDYWQSGILTLLESVFWIAFRVEILFHLWFGGRVCLIINCFENICDRWQKLFTTP